jgi:hypothetical protein
MGAIGTSALDTPPVLVDIVAVPAYVSLVVPDVSDISARTGPIAIDLVSHQRPMILRDVAAIRIDITPVLTDVLPVMGNDTVIHSEIMTPSWIEGTRAHDSRGLGGGGAGRENECHTEGCACAFEHKILLADRSTSPKRIGSCTVRPVTY